MRLLNIVADGLLGDTLLLFTFLVLVGTLLKKRGIQEAVGQAATVLLGWLMLLVGMSVMMSALGGIDGLLGTVVARSGKGVTQAGLGALLDVKGSYAHAQAVAVLLAYAANVVWARFTRAKYLFLNPVHVLLGTALVLVLFRRAGVSPYVAVPIAAALVGSAMAWLPYLAAFRVSLMSPGRGVGLGSLHTGLLLGVGLLAKKLGVGGRKGGSKDDEGTGLRSPIVVSGLIVSGVALLLAINAGGNATDAALRGVGVLALIPSVGSSYHFIGAVMLGLVFAVGLWIVVDSISWVTDGISDAIRGFDRALPGIQPALGAVFMFEEAPRTVVTGFLLSLAGGTLGYYLFGWLGLGAVVPGMVAALSAGHLVCGGAAAVIAERVGGRRAFWILAPAHGLVLALLAALAQTATAGVGRAGVGAVAELSDLSVVGALLGGILSLFS
jgi:PTS system ascorbate-specific IIC component